MKDKTNYKLYLRFIVSIIVVGSFFYYIGHHIEALVIYSAISFFSGFLLMKYQTEKYLKEMTRQDQKGPNEKKLFPKNYGEDAYLFTVQKCPGYAGYKPDNLDHKVCGYCGSTEYYH